MTVQQTTWTHAGKDDRKYPALMLPQIKALTRQTVTIRTDFFEKIMAMNKDVFFAQEKVDRECWSKFSFPDGEVSKDAWVCTVRTSLPGGDVSFNITSTSWDVAKPNHLAKLTARVSDLDQAGVFYGQG